MENNKAPRGGLFVIFSTALVTLIVLSLLPWGESTNNLFKDFSLLSDLIPQSDRTYITHEELDPELATLQSTDTVGSNAETSEIAVDVPVLPVIESLPDNFEAPRADDGSVLIEDYSADNSQLAEISAKLQNASSRVFRIAVLGDSYIEGDILTQDIRSMLQERYGGSGIGYMAAYSAFPGFRQSVTQSGQGWEQTEIRKMSADGLRVLQGQYYTGRNGAEAMFKGSRRQPHADAWYNSTLMFIAPSSGNIDITVNDSTITYPVEQSTDVQTISYKGRANSFGFTSDIDNLIVLGAWLQSPTGVQLDCMSLRGNSGISHRNLNAAITSQMRRYIDYDLIVLEFGINALSSEQTNYNQYANAMCQVVSKIQSIYPNAAILMLGIGDRGQKQGTEVGSMATAQAMVAAQRDAARRSGVLFWDTREAMGGNGAAVDWHNRGLINADYIHLNHKGGKAMAEIFVNSLINSLQ